MSTHDTEGETRIREGLIQAIEAHLAQGEPAATTQAMERLVEAGLRRRAALQCLGEALAAELVAMAMEGRAFDEEAWARRLERVEPSEWIARQMKRDLLKGG